MLMPLKFLFLFIFIFPCCWIHSFAQQTVSENGGSIEKIKTLNLMSLSLQQKIPEKALIYAQQALLLSERQNYQAGISDALFYIANAYYKMEDYSKSLEYFLKAVKFYKIANNLAGESIALKTIGNIYYEFGDYEQSLAYYLEALKVYEKAKDQAGISASFSSIATVNSALKNYEESFTYYQKALQIAEKINDSLLIGVNLGNIATAYRKNSDLNKALEYYNFALAIFRKINNQENIANTLNGLGDVQSKMGNSNNALRDYLEATKIGEEINDHNIQSYAYLGIGDLYIQTNNYVRAIDYLQKSLKMAQKLQSKVLISQSYQKLAIAYENQENTKEAFRNFKLFKIYHDSVYNESRLAMIAEMQTRFGFDTQKKENELQKKVIESLSKEKTRQNLDIETKRRNIRQRDLIIALFVGITILVGVLLYLVYQARKRSIAINRQLTTQNQEINRQKIAIEKQTDQLNLALTKITDSIHYAQTIQHAILPSEERLQVLLGEYFIISKPKEIVSGDFYWVNSIEGKTLIAVVDCTGHGVSGGFMTMIGDTLLNEIINVKRIFSPAEILELLNQGVVNVLEKYSNDIPIGMEMGLCLLEKDPTNSDQIALTFAGAKRSLFLIEKTNKTKKEIIELRGDRDPIGFGNQNIRIYQNQSLKLQKGTLLYMTSDGFADQANPQNKRIGTPLLKKTIAACAHEDLTIQKQALEKLLTDFQQTAAQRDDITLLGWRV